MARRNFHLNIRNPWIKDVLADLKTFQDSNQGNTAKRVLTTDIMSRSSDGIDSMVRLFYEMERSSGGPDLIGPKPVVVTTTTV